ncbi:MAG: hypothetical protein M1536_08860 [Firmicutes bacterium]|nr:hypothetical protein [Bacillota bacterium]
MRLRSKTAEYSNHKIEVVKVKNYLKIFMLVMIITFLAAAAVSAANPQIFIRNQPFKEKVFLQKGDPFVPLEALLKALKFGWSIDENCNVNILPAPGGKETSIKLAPYKLSFQEKVISAEVFTKDNIVFVNLKNFSTALGATYNYNKENNIVDVLFPKTVVPVTFAIPKPVPSPAEKVAAPTASQNSPSGELIVISKPEVSNESSGLGGTRVTANVKNISNYTIENIKLTCAFTLDDGSEAYKDVKIIKLAGGETQKVEFYWTNPSSLMVSVKVKAEYPK